MDLIKVNHEKCARCGICAEICPPMILSMEEHGPKAVEPQNCIACGHCVAICPNAAIDNIKAPLADQVDLKKFPVIDGETAHQYLRSRRSIRRFKDKSVPPDQLLKLVDIARFAPTASNKQGISYIIIKDEKVLKQVRETTVEWMEVNQSQWWSFPLHIRAYREKGIDGILHAAPHLIVATAPKDFKNGRENTILSFAYLELFANALGLGSVWAGLIEMCAFKNYQPLLALFSIPEDKVFTGAVMVGYPQYKFHRLVDRNPLDVAWV